MASSQIDAFGTNMAKQRGNGEEESEDCEVLVGGGCGDDDDDDDVEFAHMSPAELRAELAKEEEAARLLHRKLAGRCGGLHGGLQVSLQLS